MKKDIDEVVALMESSKSQAEWDANANRVKMWWDGYPSFWYDVIIRSGLAERVAMSFGSSTGITICSLIRKRIQDLYYRPITMPPLAIGEKVVGVYNNGLKDIDKVCNSLEEMQGLYDFYASGGALTLRWFIESYSESYSE